MLLLFCCETAQFYSYGVGFFIVAESPSTSPLCVLMNQALPLLFKCLHCVHLMFGFYRRRCRPDLNQLVLSAGGAENPPAQSASRRVCFGPGPIQILAFLAAVTLNGTCWDGYLRCALAVFANRCCNLSVLLFAEGKGRPFAPESLFDFVVVLNLFAINEFLLI